MRFAWCIASLLAASDCAMWAVGLEPQRMITPDYLWLLWIPFVGWLIAASAVFWAE